MAPDVSRTPVIEDLGRWDVFQAKRHSRGRVILHGSQFVHEIFLDEFGPELSLSFASSICAIRDELRDIPGVVIHDTIPGALCGPGGNVSVVSFRGYTLHARPYFWGFLLCTRLCFWIAHEIGDLYFKIGTNHHRVIDAVRWFLSVRG